VLYRTVAEIAARSRWCLTGTPIQNRLEDIGSLFAFLRVSPLQSLANFRKHIAIPFDEGGKRRQLAIQRFAKLLDSLCLRRTKEVLHLPEEQHRVRNIRLSLEERTQYDQTQNIMSRAVRNQNGMFNQKSTLGMFQVQLQLRIICNHGTWQQPFSWNRRKLHLLDEREAMETSLGRDGEVTCSACRQTMPLFNTGSMFHRYTEHCNHVLCSECLEQSMPSGQESWPTRCQLCTPMWDPATQASRPKQASQEDTYFRAEGRSSKMETLMNDVLADVSTTKRYDMDSIAGDNISSNQTAVLSLHAGRAHSTCSSHI
jgi:SWI/SNF-related matrix-associated actin-dependent regulator of chromatin subfamily A3